MSPSANVLSRKLRHGGLARSPLADTELLGETFARGVEDRMRRWSRRSSAPRSAPPASPSSPTPPPDHRPGDARPRRRRGRRHAGAHRGRVRPRLPPGRPHPRRRPGAGAGAGGARPSPPSTWRSAGCTSTRSSPPSRHAIGANLGRPLTKGLTIRDLRQNLSQLRLAPDYIDVMVFGMELTPRRGRPARALHADPAALGARRDPRLDPGPQRPGRRATAPTTSGRR